MPDRGSTAAAPVLSPPRLILRLAALIFVAEALIMMFGTLVLEEGPIDWRSAFGLALIDGFLLILISSAAIYRWIVKPYVRARDDAEHALRVSEVRIRSIIENSPDSIVLKDRAGRFQVANRNFLERYGLTDAQVLGKTAYDIQPKNIADQLAAEERTVLETGAIVRDNRTVPFADGRKRDVTVTRFPIFDSRGLISGVGSISVDVTEQRMAERELREAQKMEAVGQLTGGVAHDFNNLLAVILGNAELVEERLGADDQPTRAIVRAALRGAELTQRLLAFSRRQPLHSKPVDLNELIEETTELLGRTLGVTIEIETDLDQDLWPSVADSGQVENALLNLAINARDAMPAGGKLRIETVNATLDAEQASRRTEMEPGDYVVLGVEDSGAGIAPDDLGHVFEPFFTTKDVGQGSGLGLSMVYGFARQSGGGVEIESQLGLGTTVRLYLPRGHATADLGAAELAARADGEPALPQARGETILVVEDDAEVRTIAKSLLEGLGYSVLIAEDAKAGLVALERNSDVRLLLSDIALPGGVSGPDMAEEVRRGRPDLKVLFMSGHGCGAISSGDRFDRGSELLMKPFHRRQLALKVRAVLDGGGA
jgi:PAS domain S-box-containing protein